MLETVYAQLRFAGSLLFGRPFHLPSLNRLVDAVLETRREFGVLSSEAGEVIAGPTLDEASLREIQARRFRTQLQRGVRETEYYTSLFTQRPIDLKRFTFDDIHRIPITGKDVLQTNADALVRCGQRPSLQTLTTGTTGQPTGMFFTAHEMNFYVLLAALGFLINGAIGEQDVVQVSTSARALLGNGVFMGACQRIGALVYQTGIIEPEQALGLLAARRTLPGKKGCASVLMTYPSYLGKLVESGRRLGYGPQDFGLERIILGGEVVTAGVKQRCKSLFGEVVIHEGYGITEAWPLGGSLCEAGHLHFDPMTGLVEVVNVETGEPVQPGQVGTLVLTPFAPHRESMVILRYDTGDLVQALAGPCTCSLRHQPAVGPILGKRKYAVRHAAGWTYPRQVLEAVESIVELPLPARCGSRAHAGGVAVEVAVPQPSDAIHHQLEEQLHAHGVPLSYLTLVSDPALLSQPLLWRGDLHEGSFATAPAPEPAMKDVALLPLDKLALT
jgi:phenylacetate-CoA ligase